KIWIGDGTELRETRAIVARIKACFGVSVGKRGPAHDNGTALRGVRVMREPNCPRIECGPGTEGGSSGRRGGTARRRSCLRPAGKRAGRAEQAHHSQAALEKP